MRSSLKSDREIIADRRTPPTTTTSPTLHRISCASSEVSFRPVAPRNFATTYLNKSTSGSGPDALPPKVLSLAPAGRTPETSHLGTSPAYSKARTCRKALAHPSLESLTLMTVPLLYKSTGISGNLDTYFCSTLKPTPVPHNKIYIASSKALGSSIGKYEQL